MDAGKITPMMEQYLKIKAAYQDTILFYRMGDFYEMFCDDAVEASRILGIALTTRDKGKANPVPMCGVPYHSASGYIAKLIKARKRVAVCEQGEVNGKGLVPREVVEVITPGLITEDNQLEREKANYLMAVCKEERGGAYGLAFVDISTGDFRVTELRAYADFESEVARVDPSEIIALQETLVPDGFYGTLLEGMFRLEKAQEILCTHFRTIGIEGLGLSGHHMATCAAAMVLRYVQEKQKGALPNIIALRFYNPGRYMILGANTKRNLELFASITGGVSGSLYHVLNQTVTSMGSRRLADWMAFPLMEIVEIDARLDAVEELKESVSLLNGIRKHLKEVYDLERILGRISSDRATPRDMIALAQGLEQVPEIKGLLAGLTSRMLAELSLDPLIPVAQRIRETLVPDPPHRLGEGNVIANGVNTELDELRNIRRDSRKWIAENEASERKNTGINSLKIGYNKVFGYYIEVTKTHAARVPERYIRKQTLVNAERYITPELKEYEAKLLGAQDAIFEIEARIFRELRAHVVSYTVDLKRTTDALITLDVLAALAWVALQNDYTRPQMMKDRGIEIRGGRHPVVEKVLKPGEFVPNDCRFDPEADTLHIVTGPNMAGKSTYMRQIALITIMAQMGSFVSARQARVGVADRIFTRIGALDNLSAGQSTFLVEMNETANILNNATEQSLVVLDEIGRGTSTYDGMSLAWAVAEYLDQRKARTFFATHYHELADLARRHKGIKNFHMAVDESDHEVVFLREVRRGAIGKSYGIHVAKLAGIPEEVIQNARFILASIGRKAKTVGSRSEAPLQTSLFETRTSADTPILKEIGQLDLSRTTPIDALNLLYALQAKMGKSG